MKKDLKKFLEQYESATNTHDFSNVWPLIAPKAVYWFSDGRHVGIAAIEKAFVSTWKRIKAETYRIKNVRWLVVTDAAGVCAYDFEWSGSVQGNIRKGKGRGTNVIIKRGNQWQILHEHLSTD